MPASSHPFREARLRNGLLLVATALYLITVVAWLYTVENAYYLRRKWDIVQKELNKRRYIDSTLARECSEEVRNFLVEYRRVAQLPPEQKAAAEANLATIRERTLRKMNVLLDSSEVITAVVVEDGEDREILGAVRRERFASQHDFSNSLLTRSFENSMKRSYEDALGHPVGQFRIFVTTARNVPEIEELTAFYRFVMVASLGGFTLTYLALLRFVILPLRRVIMAMQGAGSPILPSTGTLLERAYNQLARDAILTRFSRDLRDQIAQSGLSYAEPILEQIPQLVARYIGVADVQAWTITRKSATAPWRIERQFLQPSPWLDQEAFQRDVLEKLEETDPSRRPEFWSVRLRHFQAAPTDARPWFCDLLDATPERVWMFLILVPPGAAPPSPWWIEFFGRVSSEIRYALRSIENQRRLILQEKSKANISLSRNLGHDLTNIIATGKLELMTLKAAMAKPPEELSRSPAKSQIFRESLQALLNNTRLLQEVVNLYRSFSYLEKPRFEETSLEEVIRDVVELFRMSVSSAVKVDPRVEPNLPMLRVEPRLLRLALFNILQNALEAIKRVPAGQLPPGGAQVIVSARLISGAAKVELAIEDTGPGIRDAAGNLLPDEALSEVFRLGYTTKKNQEGEGLGLNWVQSIICQFHNGEVLARNREQGGAAFLLRLPLEQPSDPSASQRDSSRSGELPALIHNPGEPTA